jgi:hypothetical protein
VIMSERFIDPLLHLILRACGFGFAGWGLMLLLTPLPLIEWFLRLTAPAGDFAGLWSPCALLSFMLRTAGAISLWLGASFLLAARDPGRYAAWTQMSGLMLLFYGAVSLAAAGRYGPPQTLLSVESALAGRAGGGSVRFSRLRRLRSGSGP